MKAFIIMSVAACAVFYACSDGNPSKNSGTPCDDITTCDTCDTHAELTHYGDSAAHNYPHAGITVMGLRKSPVGNLYAACSYVFSSGGSTICLFHLGDPIPKIIQGGTWAEWSPDGNLLLYWWGVIDVNGEHILYEFPDGYKYPTWSLDGNRIYLLKGTTAYKMRTDGSDLTLLADSMGVVRQLNDSVLVTVLDGGVYTYNLNTHKREILAFSSMPANLELLKPDIGIPSDLGCWDLSPDGTKILADFGDTRGILYREDRGLYLFVFENRTVRKVLPGQYWGQAYYPRWSSNSTFFASYLCRKDNAAMEYEFDLNGKTIRQMTYTYQKFWL